MRRCRNFCRDKRGISPAFSSVILTAGVIVMILVAMSYATNMLNSKMGENEFNTNKKFMQTAAQQIDDIAWTIGRTQTVNYQNQYGQAYLEEGVLSYTFEVYHGATSSWETLPLTVQSGILLYNMPLSAYSLPTNYFERIPYSANNSFLQTGSTVAVTQVFITQKAPMAAGDYLRIAVVPTVRVLDSAAGTASKIYVPSLISGTRDYSLSSITMTGNGINKAVEKDVTQIRVTVAFPKADLGFDASFFNFHSLSETKILAKSSLAELYVGELQVTIGNA